MNQNSISRAIESCKRDSLYWKIQTKVQIESTIIYVPNTRDRIINQINLRRLLNLIDRIPEHFFKSKDEYINFIEYGKKKYYISGDSLGFYCYANRFDSISTEYWSKHYEFHTPALSTINGIGTIIEIIFKNNITISEMLEYKVDNANIIIYKGAKKRKIRFFLGTKSILKMQKMLIFILETIMKEVKTTNQEALIEGE